MTERNDPAFYRVRELIKEWGWYVRKDNRYETMYKKQPFIDGQGVQRVVIHDDPWPDMINAIDLILRTMPVILYGPIWMKYVDMLKDNEAANEIGKSPKEYRERIDRAIWYSVGRIDG